MKSSKSIFADMSTKRPPWVRSVRLYQSIRSAYPSDMDLARDWSRCLSSAERGLFLFFEVCSPGSAVAAFIRVVANFLMNPRCSLRGFKERGSASGGSTNCRVAIDASVFIDSSRAPFAPLAPRLPFGRTSVSISRVEMLARAADASHLRCRALYRHTCIHVCIPTV